MEFWATFVFFAGTLSAMFFFLGHKIDSINTRIDGLGARMDAMNNSLGARIDNLSGQLQAHIERHAS